MHLSKTLVQCDCIRSVYNIIVIIFFNVFQYILCDSYWYYGVWIVSVTHYCMHMGTLKNTQSEGLVSTGTKLFCWKKYWKKNQTKNIRRKRKPRLREVLITVTANVRFGEPFDSDYAPPSQRSEPPSRYRHNNNM